MTLHKFYNDERKEEYLPGNLTYTIAHSVLRQTGIVICFDYRALHMNRLQVIQVLGEHVYVSVRVDAHALVISKIDYNNKYFYSGGGDATSFDYYLVLIKSKLYIVNSRNLR